MWIFLALLALWPIVQHVLVRAYRVSRWELGAYGMYARPDIDVRIELDPPVEADTTELASRSRMIGELADAEPRAREIMEAHALHELTILRTWRSLEADGRLHSFTKRERFRR
jgi:hypothetical protein